MTSSASTRRRVLACALLSVVVALPAAAGPSPEDFRGTYSYAEDGITRSVSIEPYQDDVLHVQLSVNTGQCTGEMEGYGGIEDGKLVVTPPTQDDTCEIKISRSGSGITVRETKCLNWHGASCDFSAKLEKG